MGKRDRRSFRPSRVTLISQFLPFGLLALLIGCASPGQPRPPSLQLPQVVRDLSAQRVGDTVHLRWTTPSQTTDNLPVPPRISAVICRRSVASTDATRPCRTTQQLAVKPGPFEIDDVLPPTLTSGPPGLVAYRIEVLNRAGRSAGRSGETFAASGAAPSTVTGLTATPIRHAVRLGWKPHPEAASSIELDRTDVSAASTQGGQVSARKHPFLASTHLPSEIHLSARQADEPDAGGTIDRSAQVGETYIYTAQRVQTAILEGHSVSLRSAPSAKITVELLDNFPPEPPIGLEAAPGGADTPSIDLSWQPGAEADLAGYNVYRRELAAYQGELQAGGSLAASWNRLNSATVPVPAFRDSAVHAGKRYIYRVTAVDSAGNESPPGNEVRETPGTR